MDRFKKIRKDRIKRAMVNFAERKKQLLQDIHAQKSQIEQIELTLEQEQARLRRLEGAAMLCDEFLQEQAKEEQPAGSEAANA
jgi:hypothetical protein